MNTENVLFELRGPWNVPIHFSQSLIFLVLIVVGINADPVNLPYALAFVAI
ncbi:hypothetical protein [Ruegeria faecimaris]|uniref:hypothetical protein n=1 Tax=Ruegeria faecimaris TaxID=686389 RepID=UPI002491276A|nr:hypothetical protein [Ruegeria faecimaris]